MKWISVNDELPVIPKGKYGISVIIATFDSCYEEMNPGNGYSVYPSIYGIIDYSRMPMFAGSIFKDGTKWFLEEYESSNGIEYGLVPDRITHWMYFPEPPMFKPEGTINE